MDSQLQRQWLFDLLWAHTHSLAVLWLLFCASRNLASAASARIDNESRKESAFDGSITFLT
jgi:hypothetical protein